MSRIKNPKYVPSTRDLEIKEHNARLRKQRWTNSWYKNNKEFEGVNITTDPDKINLSFDSNEDIIQEPAMILNKDLQDELNELLDI